MSSDNAPGSPGLTLAMAKVIDVPGCRGEASCSRMVRPWVSAIVAGACLASSARGQSRSVALRDDIQTSADEPRRLHPKLAFGETRARFDSAIVATLALPPSTVWHKVIVSWAEAIATIHGSWVWCAEAGSEIAGTLPAPPDRPSQHKLGGLAGVSRLLAYVVRWRCREGSCFARSTSPGRAAESH